MNTHQIASNLAPATHFAPAGRPAATAGTALCIAQEKSRLPRVLGYRTLRALSREGAAQTLRGPLLPWLLGLVALCCVREVSPPKVDELELAPAEAWGVYGERAIVTTPQGQSAPLGSEATWGCGAPNPGLSQAAKRLAEWCLRYQQSPDTDAIVTSLRRSGVPYVWPTASTVFTRLPAAPQAPGQPLRAGEICGSGRASGASGTWWVRLSTVPEASLAPLPLQPRVGEPLRFLAELSHPARAAQVLLQPPQGESYAVPSHFDGRRVRTHLVLPTRGPWQIQVLADFADGPRPVLEAQLYVDTELPQLRPPGAGPKAPASAPDLRDIEDVMERLNEDRHSAQRPPLKTHRTLQQLAARHALELARAGRLAHDLGQGGPVERLRHALPEARHVGENLASGSSLEGAHQALWNSPAHRQNLLDRRFTHGGIGIAFGPDDRLWLCELYAELPNE